MDKRILLAFLLLLVAALSTGCAPQVQSAAPIPLDTHTEETVQDPPPSFDPLPTFIYEGTFHESSDPQTAGPYVLTYPCPEEYIEYAKEQAAFNLENSLLFDPLPLTDFTLGTPYCYCSEGETTYFFPIWSGDEILFNLLIWPYPDGQLSSGLNYGPDEFLAEALGKTSPEHPIAFTRAETGENLCYRDAAALMEGDNLIVVDTRESILELHIELPEETTP